MSFEQVRRVADAVLFEGYVLYPYRASARKNQLRWQFGVLSPRAWSEAGGGEAWWMETQCLVEADAEVALDVELRFLHARRRRVEAARGGAFAAVDSLEVDGRIFVPWDEGEVREVDVATTLGDGRSPPCVVPFEIPAASETELLATAAGACGGRLVRSREALHGTVRIEAERTNEPRLLRLRVRVDNVTPCDPGLPRDDALTRALLGAHLLLAVHGGAFVSLLDPPAWARAAAAACTSVRAFPVLGGELGRRDLVLSAPIILYDHPQIAPESPGDLFDATEIDEILTLRTMLLTDEERRWARATDGRAAAILDRIDALSPERFARLHGAIRDLAVVDDPRAGAGEQAPPRRALRIGGAVVGPGARVRIRPGARRTDAQDMFLAGLTATVERIERDVDARDCLAVTVDADPAADLHRWHGRFLYFYPDEVEVLDPVSGTGGDP